MIDSLTRRVHVAALFAADIWPMETWRRELLIHEHYSAQRGERAGARGCFGSYRGAGTKQDVNLARKTLYFPRAKLQMDVLGADPDSRSRSRARTAYELVL